MRPLAVLILALASLPGCASNSREDTLVFRPRPGWDQVPTQTQTQFRPPITDLKADTYRQQEYNVPPTKVADVKQLSMTGLIKGRQTVSSVASIHGLSPRTPTIEEQQGGWTEVYASPTSQVAVREEMSTRSLTIRIKEPSQVPDGQLTIKQELAMKLGLTK